MQLLWGGKSFEETDGALLGNDVGNCEGRVSVKANPNWARSSTQLLGGFVLGIGRRRQITTSQAQICVKKVV